MLPILRNKFQYQKGAIKTMERELQDLLQLLFQYQKGAIKTPGQAVYDSRVYQFQYQKGAIKTTALLLPRPCAEGVSIPKRCD